MSGNLRHGAGFIASGIIATITDALVLAALVHGLGANPFAARVVAIAVAMVAAYFAHRKLSFRVETPPSWREFMHFASVAAGAASVNYAIYAGVLVVRPGTEPLIAFAIAAVFATALSYLGLRFGVFRKPEI